MDGFDYLLLAFIILAIIGLMVAGSCVFLNGDGDLAISYVILGPGMVLIITVVLTYFTWLFLPFIVGGLVWFFWGEGDEPEMIGGAYALYLVALWAAYRYCSYLIKHSLFPF